MHGRVTVTTSTVTDAPVASKRLGLQRSELWRRSSSDLYCLSATAMAIAGHRSLKKSRHPALSFSSKLGRVLCAGRRANNVLGLPVHACFEPSHSWGCSTGIREAGYRIYRQRRRTQ